MNLSVREFWVRLSEFALMALVIVTPIMMNGVMNRGYEISKLLVAEPLAMLALGAAICAAALTRLGHLGGAATAPCIALLWFLVVGCASTWFSETSAAAFWGSYYRREGLLAWAAYAAVFVAVLAVIRRERQWQRYLDALLLASVVPCAYAILQNNNLDFYFVANRDASRPNGTLGNPIFLAAYLALLVPICVARCWQARGRMPELVLWSCLGLLQIGCLVMTQTRGPLLALFGGLVLFAACLAAQARARRVFVCGIAVFAFGMAILATINTVPAAARWAGSVPALSRLVFSLDGAASSATTLATRSAVTRLGIWQAGTSAFAAAPLASKLIGYGPESAYVYYFAHMPASVMRAEGYWESNSFDRLHADALDIGLNFGLLGWLAYVLFFCSVIYAAARALFGLRGIVPASLFAAFSFWGGAFSAAAAIQLGLSAAAVPAFALGIGGGWFLFLLGCAWRTLRAKSAIHGLVPAHQWSLLAALTCALVGFWMDAQINIPVMTTRLVSFGIAALILVLAMRERDPAGLASDSPSADDESRPAGIAWVVAFALIAACASFLAPVVDQSAAGGWTVKLHLRMIPMLCMLGAGIYAAWALARGSEVVGAGVANRSEPRRWFVWLAVALTPPAVYAALHYGLAVDIGGTLSVEKIDALVVVSMVGAVFIVLMCVIRALSARAGVRHASSAASLRSADFAAVPIAIAMVLGAGYAAWLAVAADVAGTAATWVELKGKPDLVDPLLQRAVQLMPHERYYQRQSMQRPAVLAAADIQTSRGGAASYPEVKRNLMLAEARAKANMARWPQDPWFVFSLANYTQLRALKVFRPLDPGGGDKAAAEARALFMRAHQMLPTQPLFLRNWAQFEFEEGNIGDAAQLLERMESIIPNEVEPYLERISMAQKLGDVADIPATLERAKRNLPPDRYRQVEDVAKKRQ